MSAGRSIFQRPNRPKHPGSMSVPSDDGSVYNSAELFAYPSRRGNRRDQMLNSRPAKGDDGAGISGA